MSAVGVLVGLTVLAVVGAWIAANGWLQPAPSLPNAIQRLESGRIEQAADDPSRPRSMVWLASPTLIALADRVRLMPSATALRLIGRNPQHHVGLLAAAACAGLAAPIVVLTGLQAAGLASPHWFVPVGLALGCAALAPFVVTTSANEGAEVVRSDMRYQVSAYLDMVTMLLAGNTGYEGALEQAAHAGDGRLFGELRRRMREAAARGDSGTNALRSAGAELGIDELEQIAATARLSAAEGAPVAKTLSAKCATLRSSLASEQEAEARLRTSRLTTPIVGMALIFMALVIYPALTFS